MLRITWASLFFLGVACFASSQMIEDVGGEVRGRMWDAHGDSPDKRGGVVLASLPIRDWAQSEHHPTFFSAVAFLELTAGDGGYYSFLLYESPISGIYWMTSLSMDGQDRRGRGGARVGFKIYLNGGILNKGIQEGGMSEKNWTEILEGLFGYRPGARKVLSGANKKADFKNMEIVTKVHPDPPESRERGEIGLVHILKQPDGLAFDMVDITDVQ